MEAVPSAPATRIRAPNASALPDLAQLAASEPDPERLANRAFAAPALRQYLRGAVGERKLTVFLALCRGEGHKWRRVAHETAGKL